MAFFGLVWIASWVGCFFPSNQDLLNPSEQLPSILPAQLTSKIKTCTTAPVSQQQVERVLALEAPNFWDNILLKLRKATGKADVGVTVIRTQRLRKEKLSQEGKTLTLTDSLSRQCSSSELQAVRLIGDQVIYQIRVKNLVVAEVTNQAQATQIVRRLEKLLSFPKLDTSALKPASLKGTPVVQFGSQVLLTVNPAIMHRWSCNAELLAIHWANNLRITLGGAPMTLAEAQARMHGLQESNELIEGIASWYGPYFHGRITATGEVFDETEFTAAHPWLPFDTYLKVTNLSNGKSVIVRVNDRGPYIDNRMLDLSREAARLLESETAGIVPIQAVIMQPTGNSSSGGQTLARL